MSVFDFTLPLWGYDARWAPRRKIQSVTKIVRVFSNWPRVLLDHLGLMKADHLCKLRSGLELEVRGGASDRHIAFEVFAKIVYPIRLRPGSCVIDIGAHIGCFSILAASQGARVYSFEPMPANLTLLRRNLEHNSARDVRVFPMAVGSQTGRRKLFLPDDDARTSEYTVIEGRGARFVEVDCTTLDDILRDNRLTRVDLLKIDCEGGEYEILYRASRESLDKVRAMVIECETLDGRTDASPAAMLAFLNDLGFETTLRENLVYAERRD